MLLSGQQIPGAAQAVRGKRHRRIRRLVRQQGRQPQFFGRLFQSQYPTRAGRSHRAQQPDRTGWARPGAAVAFPPRPPVRDVRRAGAERVHPAGQIHVDDRRERPVHQHSSSPGTTITWSAPFIEIAVGNTPPVIRFDQNGSTIQGPIATVAQGRESHCLVIGAAAADRLGH